MTDFIKKLEEEFNTQIIYSKDHIWENYYDVDKDGKIITLFLRYVDLNKLDVLLPIAESLVNLAVIDCKIKTLRGLKSFTRLEALSLRLNNLHSSTMGYLRHLKNLKKLDLRGTNLKDTSHVSSLTNLEMLFIGGNSQIRDNIKSIIGKFNTETRLSATNKELYPNHFGQLKIDNPTNSYFNLNKLEFINKIRQDLFPYTSAEGGIEKIQLQNAIQELEVTNGKGTFKINKNEW
ncbi:hypothetical protein LF887_15480 [Chryseobacterium sp. MEBOG06]|uniref:leucine-rich repeat domain-containing protein n=1 Tax=Chryseobacterium sp. MEBOG06 TaxID=2879938 RepID=UPI001F3E3863|nr:leucine-rich repeat domain-containing protein [Chryseobacterium sp. MEBOG06]UKB82405.1 hypothetical protein LF887_15480 [Chryseobacterium sp. MEBOG06]